VAEAQAAEAARRSLARDLVGAEEALGPPAPDCRNPERLEAALAGGRRTSPATMAAATELRGGGPVGLQGTLAADQADGRPRIQGAFAAEVAEVSPGAMAKLAAGEPAMGEPQCACHRTRCIPLPLPPEYRASVG
jgi:hypothetical protein